MPNTVPLNSGDVEQQRFLAALRAGEASKRGDPYSTGFSDIDLSNAPRDRYGFPIWGGKVTREGPTHAAGAYQFQPGTWRAIAARYGLNFSSPRDQDAGAWYNAQERYARETGGRSLDADLDAGLFEQIRGALSREWTSLRDNPRQFLEVLTNGASAELAPGATDTTGTPGFFESPFAATSAYFVRGALILTGIAILLVALWALLSQNNLIPQAISLGK